MSLQRLIFFVFNKAKHVAWHWNGLSAEHPWRISEVLYVTPKGRWFLHGEGGAASVYANNLGAGRFTPGEKIIPYTPEEAMDWLFLHDEIEALDAFFQVTDA